MNDLMKLKKDVCISIFVLLLILSIVISSPIRVSAHIDESSNEVFHTIIQPVADTYVDNQSHWENKGNSYTLHIWNGHIKHISFLEFDLSSLGGSIIISAMLFLHVEAYSVDSNQTSILGVHFYNGSWNEDELTWDTVNWSSLNETATDTTEIYLDLLEHQVWFNWTITQDVQSSKGSFLTEVVKAENDVESIFFSSRETSYVPYLNITYIKLPVHNIDTGLNYAAIREAIDANETEDGHTIFVDEGIYYEHVVVDKSLSLIGENRSTTIISGDGTGTVVSIVVDYVDVNEFTIRGGGWQAAVAIGSSFCGFSRNIVKENDGSNYAMQLNGAFDNVIDNNVIANNPYADGIRIYGSSNNKICGNVIENNGLNGIAGGYNNTFWNNTIINNGWWGMRFEAGDNVVSGNTIANNGNDGIYPDDSSNNFIYHNNFINNDVQVDGYSVNVWDDGYPSGGNYWSDYPGVDEFSGPNQDEAGSDGIGDTSYDIDENNMDNYPLFGMFSDFNATSEHQVQTICNSSISDLVFNDTAISFDVSGENGTAGFCRICIPIALMNGTYRVFVNGTEILPVPLPLPCSNTTHNYLYFNYAHSTQQVVIIPEFPSFLIPPLFMIATLLAVIVHRRKHAM